MERNSLERNTPGPLANRRPASVVFRWLVLAAGTGLLVASTLRTPPRGLSLVYGLLIAGFATFLVNYPLRLLRQETSLVHLVALGGGLLAGAPAAGWGAGLGILLGCSLRAMRRTWRSQRLEQQAPEACRGLEAAFEAGLLALALVLALSLPGSAGGWLAFLPPALLFAVLHGALYLIDFLLRRPGAWVHPDSGLFSLFLFEFLPLPFVLLSGLASSVIGAGALILLGGPAAILSYYLSGVSQARSDLERRLRELSTLNQVSQVLQSTLDLELLLGVMQVQITRLVGVDSFYVALYDAGEQRIWYPLAVKSGARQHWPARLLADRLTDRVILQGKPILFSPGQPGDSQQIDLPPSEATPTGWLGVPLISPSRTLGCLALFSLAPFGGFTPADQEVLEILSGQASVAIENALLYEQSQRRAAQLETLNRISALITASLDPQEVLAQVCRSVFLVAGAGRSAIFLLAPEEGQVRLAHAHGLSDSFYSQSGPFSMVHPERTRVLRTRKPVLIHDLSLAELESEWLAVLDQEGIRACGDFPLVAPGGEIGFLSVYFDAPHSFPPDEIELLQTFASQAALAVSNARLHARTDQALAQRVQQVSILEAIGRELAAASHSDRLFDMILSYALDFTRSPWGRIGLYDAEKQTIEIRASRGYPRVEESYPVEAGISGRAVRTRQGMVAGQAHADPDYVDLTGGEARSQISVPLMHEGQVLGVLTLESPQPDAYTKHDLAFISQLANQAAIALVNAQLYADVIHGRDRLAAVLNSVNEGILMIGAQGKILLANQFIQTLTGLAPAELTGRSFAALPPHALHQFGYSPQQARSLAETLERGQPVPEPKVTLKTASDNPEHYLERTSLPVWGSQGRPAGWMIVLRDVSEEHQIAQARELITETLVHDLRSPISAVLGALDMIETEQSQDRPLSEIISQSLQVARRSGRRVLGMVESLLEISRMQAGRLELVRSEVDLRTLSATILAEFTPQANEFGLILRNEVPGDLPKVCADRLKLARVLTNLLDNALKFTPSGGQVVFSAHSGPERMVSVKVIDTGPGVPAEFREKIFERFTQVPGRRGRRRGSGLGLTFCRLVVEAHGGRIWVEPRPAGGSIFIFTLPGTDDGSCEQG